MKSKNRIVTVKVDEKFRNLLKIDSAINGKSVLGFTKELASNDVLYSDYIKDQEMKGLRKKKKGRVGFEFNF